jgi:hypothetical protein
MRMHVIITVLLLVVTCAGGASGHENCETNELIRKMLGPLLAKTRLSGDRIVRMPRSVSNQAEFFAGDDQWTEAEKREAFDWYLWHLTATAMPVRDGIMQSGNGRNPIAVAAFKQCAAMSYTNALPAVEAYAVGDDMPARKESMELVFMWHGLDEWLVSFANGVITNSAKYSDSERNLAGRRFCDRLKLSFQEGMTNSPAWSVGVQAMYENRTSIACAVAIDSMLVDCIPEYGTSTNRLACANAIVANTNAWENCRAYFENVTNIINELVAYPEANLPD